MPYGLNIYTAEGALRLSLSDMATRVIYQFDVALNASGTHYMPFTPDWNKCFLSSKGFSASETVSAHSVSGSGNAITYAKNNYGNTGPSRVFVIAYK